MKNTEKVTWEVSSENYSLLVDILDEDIEKYTPKHNYGENGNLENISLHIEKDQLTHLREELKLRF
jgi:hypothetical protein